MNDKLIEAYEKARNGFSSDRVLADPEMRVSFFKYCRDLGLSESNDRLARNLLNLRKRKGLSGNRAKRTIFCDEHYRFASEIAIRHLERKHQATLDDVLCTESLLEEFDSIAVDLSGGFTKLEYRWSALSLRKSRSIAPEVMSHVIRSIEVKLISGSALDIEQLPKGSGLYIFLATSSCLYVGEASNLRNRLRKHFEHSDNKHLARYIWDKGFDELSVELHVLPDSVSTKTRRALETELIRSRKPQFNVLGVLSSEA